jgi:hypothetical protein
MKITSNWCCKLPMSLSVIFFCSYTFASGSWLLKQGERGSQLLISPDPPCQRYNSILCEIFRCCLVSRYCCFLRDVRLEGTYFLMALMPVLKDSALYISFLIIIFLDSLDGCKVRSKDFCVYAWYVLMLLLPTPSGFSPWYMFNHILFHRSEWGSFVSEEKNNWLAKIVMLLDFRGRCLIKLLQEPVQHVIFLCIRREHPGKNISANQG